LLTRAIIWLNTAIDASCGTVNSSIGCGGFHSWS
jgi:hypothetical protein